MASKTISGIFGGKGTPAVGSWDAMHTFATRSSDKFGGKMHAGAGYAGGQVGKALQEFYNTEKLNPCITSIKITVDPKAWTTAWEVTIDESPDGKAYVALGSWGGASGGYPAKKPPGNWAYSNYVKEKKSVAARYAKTEIKDVIDFYFPGGFRQIFFQYTIPGKFPDLPKSANAKKGTVGVKIGASGSPTGLPEYNGMLMPTVTIEPDPVVLEPVKTETIPEVPKNPDPDPIPVVPGPPNPLLVTGKISLKVKSGPGVIIGITDVDIVEGKADFSGIQFDQAGDYVITVSCTSTEVGTTELKLTILPEPTEIPQDSKGTEEPDSSGKRPIIAQIDPPGRLPSMEFDVDEVPTDDTKQVANTIGNLPFFNFNGSVINDRDIQQMSLFHDGIMPKVKITFRDSNNLLSKEPPRDDTKFEIFINPKSDNLKAIHLRFKVEDFQKLQNNAYTITGTIDIPELYRMKFKVYRGTSFEAIRNICKDLKIGLNSNIENTKDEMPWRNIGDRPYKFIADIIKHSYISEESFMAGYIDFYYCFNYVDIEKEMKRDIKTDKAIETGTMSDEKDSNKIVAMRFSSDKGLQQSSFYFIKKGQKNDSTKISMQQGYKTRTKFYDKVKKMFLVFDVDSTTTDGSKTMILKGANGDKEAFDNNYVTKYSGKIDTDNVHKNHNYAITQNKINLDNMMKNQLDIKFPNPNFNIYKFQKIDVMVVKELSTVSSDEPVEWRYSGEWMILDIVYDYSEGKLSQDVKLVRKEMGKNPSEMDEKNKVAPETKDTKNENPIIGTASETITNKPNNVYKVDETYTVQDKSGKRYVLTIKKLSENGIEVVADLKDIDYVPKTDNNNPDTIVGVTQSVEPVVEATPPIVATGSYWPDLIFDKWQDDMPQSRVTSITGHHEMWAPGYSKYLDKYENISPSSGLWIAIQKPVPDFKPEGTEKKETPFKWIIYELSDEGTAIGTKDGSKKYEIIRSRLLEEYERGLNTWKKPKGYIRVLDPSGVIVIDSDKGDTNAYTGTPYIQGSSLVDKSYFDWFESRTSITPVPRDELYSEVGGPNTIFIDMSNATKFQPGTYTLEVKYMVPKFGEFGTERILEPKDADGNNPYEEKIFKKTFTISKKSKSK